jgi:hypothetical protein
MLNCSHSQRAVMIVGTPVHTINCYITHWDLSWCCCWETQYDSSMNLQELTGWQQQTALVPSQHLAVVPHAGRDAWGLLPSLLDGLVTRMIAPVHTCGYPSSAHGFVRPGPRRWSKIPWAHAVHYDSLQLVHSTTSLPDTARSGVHDA